MKANTGKVKFVLFLAILAIVFLLVLNIALLVSYHNVNKRVQDQQKVIEQQEQTLEFYEQQTNN